MEELKTKRSLVKSQFTRTENMLRKLLSDENSLREQVERRINVMSQKWKEAQEAHDTYMMKVTDAEEIENEGKWIDELEARYEVIERETVLALRKFDSGSLVGTSTGATQVSSSAVQGSREQSETEGGRVSISRNQSTFEWVERIG